jgi:hypothetical protein
VAKEKETPSRANWGAGITAGVIAFWAFVALLILGISFYLWWGISYDRWLDNGVYAVTVTLVGFGLAGMLVTAPRQAPAKRTEA